MNKVKSDAEILADYLEAAQRISSGIILQDGIVRRIIKMLRLVDACEVRWESAVVKRVGYGVVIDPPASACMRILKPRLIWVSESDWEKYLEGNHDDRHPAPPKDTMGQVG